MFCSSCGREVAKDASYCAGCGAQAASVKADRVPRETLGKGRAIASMVLGILALGPFSILTGIPAITVGASALSRGRPGRGMAIAGVVMGVLSVVVMILAVTAILLIKKPKTYAMPPVNTERFVRSMESRLQKLEGKVAQARVDVPSAPAEQWQKLSDDIANIRRILSEMPGVSGQENLQAKVVEVNKAYVAARKTLKEITGEEEPADDQ
jgi:hypothetical protein